MRLQVEPEPSPILPASTNGNESEMKIVPNGDGVQNTLVPDLNADLREQETDHDRLSKPDNNIVELTIENEHTDLNAEIEHDHEELSRPDESATELHAKDENMGSNVKIEYDHERLSRLDDRIPESPIRDKNSGLNEQDHEGLSRPDNSTTALPTKDENTDLDAETEQDHEKLFRSDDISAVIPIQDENSGSNELDHGRLSRPDNSITKLPIKDENTRLNAEIEQDQETISRPDNSIAELLIEDEKTGLNAEIELGHESRPDDSIVGLPIQELDQERLSKDEKTRLDAAKFGLADDSITELPIQNENTDLNAEFELDSSPIQSSASDTSTDTSSSEESDQDEYVMLNPAEQARRLMQEEGGSDDESGGKAGNGTGSAPLRTLNEKPDEIVPKPDLEITPEMKISELGDVENLVENLVLIKGKTSGEYQALEYGSVLCLEDRSIIGVIAETLGRVQQPFYSVRFTNAAAISEAGISRGTKIFYVHKFSTSIFTQTLKAFKGSDASNLHDEEAGEAEIEFSDDEAEAEHRRRLKLKKQCRRDGRQGSDGFSQGLQQSRVKYQKRTDERLPKNNNTELIKSEDKVEDDELYTPLARPPNLHEIMGQREAPTESRNTFHNSDRGQGGDRSRGDRGRGRGGRGNQGSRGGFEGRNRNGNDHRNRNGRGGPGHRNGNDRRSENNYTNGPSQRSENYTFHSPPPPPDVGFRTFSAAQNSPSVPITTSTFQPYPPAFAHSNYPNQHHDPYNQAYQQPQYPQPQYHSPQSYPPPNYQQQQQQPLPQYPYPNHHHQQPSSVPYPPYQPQFQPPPSNIPPGAYINPAFFSPQSPQIPPSYPPQQPIHRSDFQAIVRGGRSGGGRPGSR